MATKRLSFELSMDQYEILRKKAKAAGTSIPRFIRLMIDELRLRPSEDVLKNYKTDPLFRRRGSFEGPVDLAENHDWYL